MSQESEDLACVHLYVESLYSYEAVREGLPEVYNREHVAISFKLKEIGTTSFVHDFIVLLSPKAISTVKCLRFGTHLRVWWGDTSLNRSKSLSLCATPVSGRERVVPR